MNHSGDDNSYWQATQRKQTFPTEFYMQQAQYVSKGRWIRTHSPGAM